MVLELNWKILVGIISAVVIFIVVILIIAGILKPENLGNGAREICLLMVTKLKILGFGAETLQVCDVFIKV